MTKTPDEKIGTFQEIETEKLKKAELFYIAKNSIQENLLDKFLKEELDKRVIGSEQWYRDPDWWFEVRSSLLYKGPDVEKKLLADNEAFLRKYLNGTCKVFYGVGTGANEAFIVKWDFGKEGSKNYSEIIAIDVCKKFLLNFTTALLSIKECDYDRNIVKYIGVHNMFELFDLASLKIDNKRYKRNSLVCLGNTVANFEPRKIFEIFSRDARRGDLLLIGFYKAKDPKEAAKVYGRISGFESLVTGLINKILRLVGLSYRKPDFKLNPKGDWIEAKTNDIILFRSKVYSGEELASFAEEFGFKEIKTWETQKAGLGLYEKVTSNQQIGSVD